MSRRSAPTATTAAIVTGASRGIGEAVVRSLAAAGIPVAMIARDADRLREIADEILAAGGAAVFRTADVGDAETVRSAVHDLAERLGAPIGLLVNAAGMIDREVPLWEADPGQWRAVVETNLIGSFNVSRAVIPLMLASIEAGDSVRGRVVELASGAGARDWARASAYSASKAALIRDVGHLHEAGHALGLRSFALAPGVVRSDMTLSMEMHRGRTEFTPVELTQRMVLAIDRGELDAWSGKYLRVTHDTPEALAAFEQAHGEPAAGARRLAIVPWGEDDPLATG